MWVLGCLHVACPTMVEEDVRRATRAASPEFSTPRAPLQRRSVTAVGSSLPLPTRATPSAATPASARRTPGAHGPLGNYRSLSRPLTTPTRTGVPTPQLGKRTFSATSIPATTPQSVKRVVATADGSMNQAAADAYELSMVRSEYEKRRQIDQHAYEVLELQLRSQSRELEALKCQRAEVLHEWEAERAANREKSEAADAARVELAKQVTELRAESLRAIAAHDERESRSRAELAEAQQRATRAEAQLAHQTNALEHSELKTSMISSENESLRARIAALESAADTRRTSTESAHDQDTATLKDQLSQQLRNVHRLESANVRLSADNARLIDESMCMGVLRETNRSLEAKVERLQSLQNTIFEKDAEISAEKRAQDAWATMLRAGVSSDEHAAFTAAANVGDGELSIDPPASLTPETLSAYISTLRGTIMGLQARIDGLHRSVEQLRAANVDLDRRATRGSEKETQLAQELCVANEALSRAQRVSAVQLDELQRCKEVLASFEQEARQGNASYDATHALHIQTLEARVATLSKENETLAERNKALEAPGVAAAEVATLQQQLSSLTSQFEAAATENEALWMRVGRGEYNSTREKCLVLSDNPVSRDLAVRTATLDALRKENAGLLEQVETLSRQLAAAGASSADAYTHGTAGAVVPMQTVENLRAELMQLQATIQLKDKGMLRLKQVFTAKANEFREAVQSLFGYKLRFMENGKVKLTSVYARGARCTNLVFRSEAGNVGEMKLQGEANEGLANVAHLRDYWLSTGLRHSVPCFLAALNLELYENTTQAIRGAFAGDVDQE